MISGPTQEEHTHFIHEQRPNKSSNDGIECIKWRRQELIHFRRSRHVGFQSTGERPRVLERTGDLCQNKQNEYGVRSVEDDVTACDEDEECGEVMANEEDVAGEEDQVMAQIHQEVSNAVIEHQALKRRIGSSKAALRVGVERKRGQNHRRSAMGKRDEAAGGFRSDLGAPISEDDEVTNKVNCEKQKEENGKIRKRMN